MKSKKKAKALLGKYPQIKSVDEFIREKAVFRCLCEFCRGRNSALAGVRGYINRLLDDTNHAKEILALDRVLVFIARMFDTSAENYTQEKPLNK